MGTMWNFIDENERFQELYDMYTSRQRDVLGMIDDLDEVVHVLQAADDCSEPHGAGLVPQDYLRELGVSDVELRWLERTGRLVPRR